MENKSKLYSKRQTSFSGNTKRFQMAGKGKTEYTAWNTYQSVKDEFRR